MEKISIITLILTVLLCPLFICPVSASPQIEITPLGGFFPGAIIRNTGDEDIYNLQYKIELTGGILNKINLTGAGFISMLPAGDEFATAIRISMPLVGFGYIQLHIEVWNEDIQQVEVTVKGILLFVFILLIPG